MIWQIKVFKTKQAMQRWIENNNHRTQWHEIFVNNAYGVEYKPLQVFAA